MLHLLTFLLLLPAAAACLYYVALALVGVCRHPQRRPPWPRADHTFAILIPAHDEANVIAATLRSVAALDYPRDRYQVFVIADNCTDGTAAIAAAMGAVCLERRDSHRRGKGRALEWALPQVLAHGADAVLVLDADCRLDRHALRAFDRCLSAGSPVLQAAVVADGPDASAVSCAVAVGSVLENDLFYRSKDCLGLTVFLRGTGMVLTRQVLEAHPWAAHSVVEDKEYTVQLLRAGVPIRFVDDVSIHCSSPQDLRELRVQRRRWTVGTFRYGKRRALRLIGAGILRRRGSWIDAGWTLLVQVKALLLLELLAALGCAAAAWQSEPGTLSAILLGVGGALVLLYGLYAILGIVALGVTRRRLALLLRLPLVIAQVVGIFVVGMFVANVWVPAVRRCANQRC